jgi:hypothetical protein
MLENTIAVIAEPALTTEQIAKAARYLSHTRDFLLECVKGLSNTQWNFKSAPDSWSIAEIMEHLVIIENRVHTIIRNMDIAPEAACDDRQIEMDEFILKEVPKRTTKVKAPEPICPANRWTGSEALQLFIESRQQTIQLLAAPLLRGRVRPHPLFGPWDGYQWLLAAASHSARHTEQILEVHADPNFP